MMKLSIATWVRFAVWMTLGKQCLTYIDVINRLKLLLLLISFFCLVLSDFLCLPLLGVLFVCPFFSSAHYLPFFYPPLRVVDLLSLRNMV